MSITDELRERIAAMCKVSGLDGERLYAIADRIDAEHKRHAFSEYTRGYHKALEEAMDSYVKLPVDADGVPIHIGDRIRCGSSEFEAWAIAEGAVMRSRGFVDGFYRVDAYDGECVRHVQPDSWERIIRDALLEGWQYGSNDSMDYDECEAELVGRCRRLAGGE